MANDTVFEVSELKSPKIEKRVRFSDDIKNVYYELEHDDDDDDDDKSGETENFPSENLTYTIPTPISEDNELHLEELTDDCDEEVVADSPVHSVPEITTFDDPAVPRNISFSDTAFLCNKDDQLNDEDSSNSNEGCSLASDSKDPDNENSINELTAEANLMVISSVETSSKEQQLDFKEEASATLIASKLQDSDISENGISPEQRNDVTSEINKRSVEVLLSEKQTSKLNSYLKKSNTNINSADELKDAVFKAWCEVKKQKSGVHNVAVEPGIKKNIVVTSQKSSSHNAFEEWQKSKRRAKKSTSTVKESKPTSQKTKEELEESKMAFEAWKKRKDELLEQRKAEKRKKEEKAKLDKLMKEQLKKEAAEAAYSAWSEHKNAISKMEKEKNQWFLEKEREKMNEKRRRNEEAIKVYYDWLESKVYSTGKHNQKHSKYKPPWVPPGKANSVI